MKHKKKINTGVWDKFWARGEISRFPHEHLIRFFAFVNYPLDSPALEIGFGAGAELMAAKQLRLKPTGVEVSLAAYQQLQKKLQRQGGGDIEIKMFDPPLLPFGDAEFLLAWSLQSFYYNLEFNSAVSELHRVLMPGGMVFISFMKPEHWYFNYSESSASLGSGIVRFRDDHPEEVLRGLYLRHFSSVDELKNEFRLFDKVEIYNEYHDLFGLKAPRWIVIAQKKGRNLKWPEIEHDYYSRIGKIK